jgi:DNA-3-methyladenine glycosylase
VSTLLEKAFFDRPVNDVARDLIGCRLGFDGVGGVIVETEAYDATDPACHAYTGLTARNAPLFGPPGVAYVYFSYGMHHLLNFVCEPEGSAAAVLVRAIEPTDGIDQMRARRRVKTESQLCSGPGKLTQALGVGPEHNSTSLLAPPFAILGRDPDWREVKVEADLRVGITKGTDLPWRYCAAESRYLSVPLSARA